LVIFWFGADLYYANANYFAEQTRRLVTGTDVRWLVLDAGAMTAIDCSGGSTVIELQEELAAKSIVLALAHVSSSLRAKLAAGLYDEDPPIWYEYPHRVMNQRPCDREERGIV